MHQLSVQKIPSHLDCCRLLLLSMNHTHHNFRRGFIVNNKRLNNRFVAVTTNTRDIPLILLVLMLCLFNGNCNGLLVYSLLYKMNVVPMSVCAIIHFRRGGGRSSKMWSLYLNAVLIVFDAFSHLIYSTNC